MHEAQVATINETVEFVLTREILQKIGVGAGDQIEITVQADTLTVRAHREEEEMMESIMNRHDQLFRRLAEGVQ